MNSTTNNQETSDGLDVDQQNIDELERDIHSTYNKIYGQLGGAASMVAVAVVTPLPIGLCAVGTASYFAYKCLKNSSKIGTLEIEISSLEEKIIQRRKQKTLENKQGQPKTKIS